MREKRSKTIPITTSSLTNNLYRFDIRTTQGFKAWVKDVFWAYELKMKEIGELVVNLLFVDKQIGISEGG